MPMTCNVLRPVILLPAGFKTWPVERLRLVLAHELVHVQQHDCLFQIVMQFACALHWYNPLVWIAAAQFRKERERACDDGVLRLGIDGPSYAGHLLELVRTLQPGATPAPAVAMAHQSHLETRLVALLDAKINRNRISRKAAFATILAAVCLLFTIARKRQQPDYRHTTAEPNLAHAHASSTGRGQAGPKESRPQKGRNGELPRYGLWPDLRVSAPLRH